MMECMILGDSIAVGTQMFYQECQLHGKGGINSWQWNRMWPNVLEDAYKALISLGTNDHKGVNTEAELIKVRNKIRANKVYWILPHGNLAASGVAITHIQDTVRRVAALHGDTVIEVARIQADNIHPSHAGYRGIVEMVKNK